MECVVRVSSRWWGASLGPTLTTAARETKYGTIRCKVRYGYYAMVWYGMVWHGIVSYGVIWYGESTIVSQPTTSVHVRT